MIASIRARTASSIFGSTSTAFMFSTTCSGRDAPVMTLETRRLLAHHASGGEFGWLAEQTFLRPFPAELRLRHSVAAPVSAPV